MANIKGFFGAAGAIAIASIAASTSALADDADKFGYSITLTGTSDYLFRGISLTSNDPAFQPFIEFTYGNPNLTWYLDFWGSNVKNAGGDPLEVDVYAGVRPVVGPVSFDLGVLYYTNPFATNSANTDYVEFMTKASITPITNLTLTGIAYATPNVGAAAPFTYTFEGDFAYTLPTYGVFAPSITGGAGFTHADTNLNYPTGALFVATNGSLGTDEYTYWNVGLKVNVDKYFMDLRYWDTDISKSTDLGGIAQAKFLFSAGVNLP